MASQATIDGTTPETTIQEQRGPHRWPVLSARVPPEIRVWFHQQAAERDISVAALVRERLLAGIPEDFT